MFSFIWPAVKKGSLCPRQIQNQHGDAWLGQETKEWDSRAQVAVQVSSSKAGLFRGVCDSWVLSETLTEDRSGVEGNSTGVKAWEVSSHCTGCLFQRR